MGIALVLALDVTDGEHVEAGQVASAGSVDGQQDGPCHQAANEGNGDKDTDEA